MAEVLSPYSSKFSDVYKELNTLYSQGNLKTGSERKSFIESKGLDPTEFQKTYKEYQSLESKGTDLKPGTAVSRFIPSVVGKLGEGIKNISETVAPKFSETVSETYYDVVPEGFERARQSTFAPTMTGVEKFITTGASYMVPGGAAVKGLSFAGKVANLGKASKVQKALKFGTGFAIGTTAIEKPEDAILSSLASEYGDRKLVRDTTVNDLIGRLKINPNDNVAAKYLKAFIGNLAVEGTLGSLLVGGGMLGKGAVKGVIKGGQQALTNETINQAANNLIKQPTKTFANNVSKGFSKTADYVIPTSIKEIGNKIKTWTSENLTSRMGLTDKGLGILLKKEGSAREAVLAAEKLTIKLQEAAKKEGFNVKGKDGEGNLKLLNMALNYKGPNENIENFVLRKLRAEGKTETANIIGQMRNNIDDLSKVVRDDIATGRFIKPNPKMTINSLSKEYDITSEELIKLNPGLTDEALKAGDLQKITLPSLQTTIDDNLGVYLNRTYRIFDDPSYAKNIPEKAREGVLNYLKGLKDKEGNALLDEKQVQKMLNHLSTGLKDTNARKKFFNLMGKRGGTILKRRQDIPVEIKALWGEVKDPYMNYVNTVTKTGNLISEFKFRQEIAEEALKQGKATRQSVPGFSEIADIGDAEDLSFAKSTMGLGGTNTNINNPLKNLFLDPSWKKAIEQGTDVNLKLGDNPLGKALRFWMSAKAGSQAAKTIYSIPTHFRNIYGNVFMSIANGTVNPFDFAKSFKATAARFKGKMDDNLRERIGYYQRLGVIDSAIDIGSLRKAAGEGFQFGPNSFAKKAFKNSKLDKVNRKIVQAYEAEDNLFKINAFENLSKRYKKAFPDMSQQQLDEFTAQRVRDMMPNYNLVPKAFKALRALPLGNFVAFPAEVVRNSKNLVKYALNDINIGKGVIDLSQVNPQNLQLPDGTALKGTARKLYKEGYRGRINGGQLKGIGMTRAAGLTTAYVASDGMVEGSKLMFGVTDEQEQSLNKIVPSWERGQSKIFTGPIARNKDGQIEADYFNLGPIDPYAYIKTPVKLMLASIANNKDYNEAESDDLFNQALIDVVTPFASPSMIAQEFLEVYEGRKKLDDTTVAGSVLRGVLKSFEPGTITLLRKRKAFYDAQERRGEGREVNQYGFSIAPGEVDIPAFIGFRRQKVNLSQGVGLNTGKHIRNMRKSKSIFSNKVRDYTVDDSKEVLDAYKTSQKEKLKHTQRLRGLVKAYKSLGMEDVDIYKALIKEGALSPDVAKDEFKDIMLADKNIFTPDMVDTSLIRFSEIGSKTPIPIDKIIELNKKLQRSKID